MINWNPFKELERLVGKRTDILPESYSTNSQVPLLVMSRVLVRESRLVSCTQPGPVNTPNMSAKGADPREVREVPRRSGRWVGVRSYRLKVNHAKGRG